MVILYFIIIIHGIGLISFTADTVAPVCIYSSELAILSADQKNSVGCGTKHILLYLNSSSDDCSAAHITYVHKHHFEPSKVY